MKKLTFSLIAFLGLFISMNSQIRLTMVNPSNDQITIKNFGSNAVDISSYRFCSLFDYVNLSQPAISVISGDFNLSQGESVTVAWNAPVGFTQVASDLGLYLPTGAFSSASAMVDFMQYGSGGQGRENVAVAAGYWTAGQFLTGAGPWYFTGTATQHGLQYWSSNPPQTNVTFQVNMQNEIVAPEGVHIAGEFQGWDPDASELTDVNADGIYEITLQVDQNVVVLYTFINGNTFTEQEVVPSACGLDNGFGGFNRFAEIGEADVELDVVCFNECEDCEPIVEPLMVDVTFRVNMQNETISANGVHLAGDFQGWNSSSTAMSDIDADGIYEVTVAIDTNSTVLYFFINGNTFTEQEVVPSACGLDNGFGGFNRFAEIGEADVELDVVCFNACEDCEPIVEPLTVDVTFRVNMQNETVSANGVHLAGDFQGWNSSSTAMSDIDADGIYEVTVAIDTNSTVLYFFINGDTFTEQEVIPSACGLDNGFGGFNRFAEIGEADVELDVVCFNACEDCEPIVEPLTVDVTFRVNMQNETVSANGVHLAGDFQGWNSSSTAMSDIDADGIYEVTVAIDTNSTVLYFFINGNTFTEQEVVPSACGQDNGFGGFNRFAEIGEADVELDVVCFGACEDCEPIIEPITIDVTFRVNMQNETVSANGVHLAGNFQGWDTAATPMTDDDADGIYTVTVEIDEWSNLNYRFINGNDWTGAEVVPSSCGLPDGLGGYNRILETGSIDIELQPVCFGECANCEGSVLMVDVTFLVNMNEQTVSPEGVHFAGNMQGWNPASSPMSDDDGDGIYEITIEMESGAVAEFRFINGNDWPFSELVPEACGTPNGFGQNNRTYLAGLTDGTFGPVCFGACVDCDDIVEPVLVNLHLSVNMNNEDISPNGVFVAGDFQGWNPASTQMTDDDSDGIYEYIAQVSVNSNVQFKFINGNDWSQQETVPLECGVDDGFGGVNRSVDIPANDIFYGPVCFGECQDCLPFTPVIVVFRVDMTNQNVSPDGVHIAGTFNDWDLTATEMSEYEPDRYQAVVVLNQNESVQYKFINGTDWSGGETVPTACGVDDGTGSFNRAYQAGTETETLPVVCFSECAECVVIPEVSITFRVDMSNETIDPAGVYLAGSFNGFSANATPMTLSGSDVYTATVTVPQNVQVTFKYLNGPDFTGVETVPFECGIDDGFGGYNRTVNTDDVDILLPEVCFSSCVDCTVGVEDAGLTGLLVYPNPAQDLVIIDLGEKVGTELLVYDAKGKLMHSERIMRRGKIQFETSAWSSGLYQLVLPGIGVQTLVVE